MLPPIFVLILTFKEKSEETEVGHGNSIFDEMRDLSCFSIEAKQAGGQLKANVKATAFA